MFDPPVESKTGLPIEEIFNNGTFEISDDDILKIGTKGFIIFTDSRSNGVERKSILIFLQ